MNQEFNQFMELSCLALARLVPEFPTHMGLFEVDGEDIPQNEFTRIDERSVQDRKNLLESMARQLRRFPGESLSDEERLSADFLSYFTQYVHERGLTGLAGTELSSNDFLLRPATGLQSELPIFLSDLHPMRHALDAEDFLARLKSIAEQMQEAGNIFVRRKKAGAIPPAFVVDTTLGEIAEFISTPVKENSVYLALAAKTVDLPGLDTAAREALLTDAANELVKHTYPAYQEVAEVLAFHKDEDLTAPGVWRLPDGGAWYQFLLQSATTTTLTAAEIHDIGVEETDRLEQEIIRATRELGHSVNTITDCHRALDAHKEPSQADTVKNRQAIIDRAEELIFEMRAASEALFHHLPSGPLEIKVIPRFAEGNRNQSYQPPSLDGSRAGFLELNLGQLLREPLFELPILVYHEIYPGHHLQISLAGEAQHLPSLRRITTFDAYIEGWAKYAETIPYEYGINTDPRLHVTRLRRELISTVNLALDTGIHHKRWSAEQAAEFFQSHTGLSQEFTDYIILRSAAVPAQMCAYKIGMMKMLALKKRWFHRHGPDADVRDFHDQVLRHGALPLDLLDRVMESDASH